MTSNCPEQSSHNSPRDCAKAYSVHFDEDLMAQEGKIAVLGECNECGRKFERVWLYSHDQCYEPEDEEIYNSSQPK